MSKTISKEDLESLFPKFRRGSRNHLISSCPFCGKDDHFYINSVTQLFDCKKCGEDGNIWKLLNHLGKIYLIGDFKSIDRAHIKKIGEHEDENEEKIDIHSPIRKMPIGFKRVFTNEYLESRKFVKRNFENNIIGITNVKPSLKNYIITAVEEPDGIKGYLSRYCKPIPESKKKEILRYKNDKGANFSKLLYGFHDVDNRVKTLILVEGWTDKITLDNFLRLDLAPDIKACATFGKKISQSQILKMLESGIENIILIFDIDAIKEMKKFSVGLSEFFNVEVGYTFKKDLNASTDLEIGKVFETLKNASEFNRKTVRLLS